MHKLFTRQVAKARTASGEVDLDKLGELVSSAYDELDGDRRRNDRSISLMVGELDSFLRERDRTAELLRQEKLKLDTALNNMSHGLAMFDAGARLVICNQRYLEMFGLAADFAMSGRTLQEIIAHHKEAGTCSEDLQEFCKRILAAVAAGRTTIKTLEAGNGRALRVVNRPMANGGWVATFEDITNAQSDSRPAMLVGGTEVILVVEDDALVRKYVIVQLSSLGYRTLEAANGAEALAIIDSGAEFDLLFTDVIMPGALNGRALAEEAANRRPSLNVLFTSGYTENAMLEQGRLPPGVLLLAKPYRKAELAHMLRQAIDAPRELLRAVRDSIGTAA